VAYATDSSALIKVTAWNVFTDQNTLMFWTSYCSTSAISHGWGGGECTEGLTFNTTYDNLNTQGNFPKERCLISWKPIGIKKLKNSVTWRKCHVLVPPRAAMLMASWRENSIMLLKRYFRVQRKGNGCMYGPGNVDTRPAHCLHPYAKGT
jgi:hypothetical protein